MEKSSCKIFLSCSKLCLVPLEPVYIYIFARKKILKLILKNQQDRFLQFYNSQIKNCQKNSYFHITYFQSIQSLEKVKQVSYLQQFSDTDGKNDKSEYSATPSWYFYSRGILIVICIYTRKSCW